MASEKAYIEDVTTHMVPAICLIEDVTAHIEGITAHMESVKAHMNAVSVHMEAEIAHTVYVTAHMDGVTAHTDVNHALNIKAPLKSLSNLPRLPMKKFRSHLVCCRHWYDFVNTI